jgi:hypothetical protein
VTSQYGASPRLRSLSGDRLDHLSGHLDSPMPVRQLHCHCGFTAMCCRSSGAARDDPGPRPCPLGRYPRSSVMTRGHGTKASATKRPGPLVRACAWCMPVARRTGHVTFVPVAQMAQRCPVEMDRRHRGSRRERSGRSERVCQPRPTDLRRSRPLLGPRPIRGSVPTKGAYPRRHPWYRRMYVTQARPGDTHPAPCLLLM